MLHHFRRVCHKRVTNCPRRRAPRAFFMVTLGAIFPEIWDCLLFGVRWLFRYRYIRHRGCAISLLLNTRNKCALAISLSLHTPSRLRYFAIAQYAQQVCAGYFAIATYAIAVALFRYCSIRATSVRWLFRYRYIRHRGCAISLLLNTRNKCALAISLSLHTPSRLRYFAIAQYAQQVCAMFSFHCERTRSHRRCYL